MQPFLVGLSGGSGSGKTTFIKALQELFPASELTVISLDHYYKPLSKQSKDQNGMVNFDLPDALDFKRLRKDLNKLIKGSSVELIEYTFNNPKVFPATIQLKPAPIIMIEGLFVFTDRWLKRKLDWRLFIEVDHNKAFKRRLHRDIKERGLSREEIEYQWFNHWLPSHQEHVLPHLKEIHLTINNDDDFTEGLEMVSERFKSIMNDNAAH